MIVEWRENLDSNFFIGVVVTDLFKAFDCIPHDLLIAKLSAYVLISDTLCYIYSYLKDRKQCVQINNKQSEFDTIISGVPEGSIFRPVLFNILFNAFFLFIPKASVHNFADDNTLRSFAKSWLHNSKMIANPDKFRVILLDKDRFDNTLTQ